MLWIVLLTNVSDYFFYGFGLSWVPNVRYFDWKLSYQYLKITLTSLLMAVFDLRESGWAITKKQKMTLREKMQTRFRYTTLISEEPHGKSLHCNPRPPPPPRHMAGEEHLSLIKLTRVKSSVTLLNILQIYKVLRPTEPLETSWGGLGGGEGGADFYDEINWCQRVKDGFVVKISAAMSR